MAGDWIPMRTALMADGHVDAIAAKLNEGGRFPKWCCWDDGDPGPLRWSSVRHMVVGMLYGFWARMQEITASGDVPFLSPREVDMMVDCPGFADALAEVGWLNVAKDGHISVPNWAEWNSGSVKKRLLEAQKKRFQRRQGCPENVPKKRDNVPPKQGLEKRREENSKKRSTSSISKPREPDAIWDVIVEIWFPSGADEDDKTRIGKLKKRFGAKNATADEIRRRHGIMEAAWGTLASGPESLAKWWDRFDGTAKPPAAPERLGRAAAPAGKYDGR